MKPRVSQRWHIGQLIMPSKVYYPCGTSTTQRISVHKNALHAARECLSGSIKLPQAKTSILECHAAAREADTNPVAQAAARAIGQCASTIHSARHCIGLALYGALAVAYDTLGTNASWKALEQCAADECWRMLDALQSVSVEDEPNPAKIVWKC